MINESMQLLIAETYGWKIIHSLHASYGRFLCVIRYGFQKCLKKQLDTKFDDGKTRISYQTNSDVNMINSIYFTF